MPHLGHSPFVAGLPFFILTFFGFFISRLVLHLTQYAVTNYPPHAQSERERDKGFERDLSVNFHAKFGLF